MKAVDFVSLKPSSIYFTLQLHTEFKALLLYSFPSPSVPLATFSQGPSWLELGVRRALLAHTSLILFPLFPLQCWEGKLREGKVDSLVPVTNLSEMAFLPGDWSQSPTIGLMKGWWFQQGLRMKASIPSHSQSHRWSLWDSPTSCLIPQLHKPLGPMAHRCHEKTVASPVLSHKLQLKEVT